MNIRDVAEIAKVSSATVSRCINHPESVNKSTRERVARVLAVTGYQTNQHVPIGHSHKNPMLGLLVPSLLNPVYTETVYGIQQRARTFGYSTLIIDTDYMEEREKQAVIDCIRHKVAGIILTVANAANNPALNLMTEFNLPYCLIHNQADLSDPCVFINHFQAGWDIADQLIRMGHRNFGMLSGEFKTSDRARQRYSGFLERIKHTAGAELTPILQLRECSHEPFESDSIEMAFLKSQYQGAKNEAPSAWFCSNDVLAIKLMASFSDIGIRVPDDVSIVGFDGLSIGQLFTHPLATVKIPHQMMGICAVDLLLNANHLKRDSQSSVHRQLDYELCLGGTVKDINR